MALPFIDWVRILILISLPQSPVAFYRRDIPCTSSQTILANRSFYLQAYDNVYDVVIMKEK
jgi:hypothetical protein